MRPYFDIQTVEQLDSVVLILEGEIDIATAPLLEERLAEAEDRAADGDERTIIVDLDRVGFIDSTGLQILITHTMSDRNRGRVLLTEGSEQVQRLFRLTGVLGHLPFVQSRKSRSD
jgi:anti-sigma B factor antagonist